MEASDRQLLDRYLAGNDEGAFRLLVERYLSLVHAVARRVTRSEDLARDVSQSVFVRLASHAALIPAGLSLTAWLHRTTHSLAASLVRGEERRKKRERLVATTEMNANDDPPRSQEWDALAPVIDRLVDALPSADRELVLARFYRGEAHAVIAARLGLSEVLARKRSSRALEKLRAMLGKRGITTTSSALATLLPAHASSAPAPAALKGLILQAAQGVTPLVPTGFQAVLLVMNATQKSLIIAAAAVFIASLGYAARPVGVAPHPAVISSGTKLSGEQASLPASARTPRNQPSLPATAEGRRARLDAILSIENALTKRREMLDFASQLQPEHFKDLHAAFDEYYQRLYSSPGAGTVNLGPEHKILATAWSRKDPESVLAVLKSDYHTVLGFALGATHPREALEWAKEASPYYRGSLLSGVGSVDLPAAVTAMLEGVPEEQRSGSLHWICSRMSDQPDIVARIVGIAEPGAERSALVRALVENEGRSVPNAPIVWEVLKSEPEVLQQTNIERFFLNLGLMVPETASEALQEMEPGPVRSKAFKGVVTALASQRSARAAFELLDRYPEESGDKLVSELVSYDMSRNPSGETIAYLARIQNPEMRESEQLRQLQQWRAKNPDAVQAWLEANPEAVTEKVRAAMHSPVEQPSAPIDFRPVETP